MFKVGISRFSGSAAFRRTVPKVSATLPLRCAAPAGLQTVRWNSTQPASEIQTDMSNLVDPATLASTASDLHSDQIGYLASVGLGEGWGPTSAICNLLEYVHVYSGLPWWATIACSTIAVRALMFPLYVKSSANMAKMSKIKPQLDKCMEAVKGGDSKERVKALTERRTLMKEHNIKTSHGFFPLLQLPIAYGFFQATRAMASIPVEGFTTQGALWFENLATVDPYLGLQILSACVVTGMIRLGGETGAQAMNPLMKKILTYLPFLSIFITYNMDAAVLVYFAANSLFSIVQSMVLRSKVFRKMVNIPQIEKPVPVEGAKPPPSTLGEWWTQYNTKMRESAEKEKLKNKVDKAEKRSRSKNQNFIKRH